MLQQRITIAPRGKRAGSRGRGGRNNLVSEQVMDESRIDRLETEIGSIAAGQDRKFRELQETLMQAIMSMNTRLDQISGNQSLERGESSHDGGGSWWLNYRGPRDSTESYGAVIPRVTKLDFPRFNGSEDPKSWICRVEQFFEFQKIAEEEKVPLATYHLEGEAQLWYQILKEEGEVTWLTLKEGLNSRYGPTEFDDLFLRSYKAQTSCFSTGVSKPIRETPQPSGEVKSISTGCLFHWWSEGRCEDRCSSHETTNVVCSSRFGSALWG